MHFKGFQVILTGFSSWWSFTTVNFYLITSNMLFISARCTVYCSPFQVPFDRMRLVFPPVPAGIIVLMLYLPIGHLLPLNVGRALLAGGLLGYMGYDLTHYYLHHGSPTPGSYFASLKTYHVAHHYINYNQGLFHVWNDTDVAHLMPVWIVGTVK